MDSVASDVVDDQTDRRENRGTTEVHHLPLLEEEGSDTDQVGSATVIGENGLVSEEWESYIPEPPDGGWGWVIMVASFMLNFIVDGIAYCFGIFLVDYASSFNAPIGTTSLSSALLCGIYLIEGPIVGALVNKYGCRQVTIAGSLIGASAFIISTFSPSVVIFQLTYGIFGGIGFGMMYLPAVVGVGFYFERKRSLATGIAVCGTGIGTFCLAPIGKELLEDFDWRSSHFFLAGLIMQGCIFGALMRPLEPTRRKNADNSKSENSEPTDRLSRVKLANEDMNEIRHHHTTTTPSSNLPPDQKRVTAQESRSMLTLGTAKARSQSTTGKELGSSKLHASAFLSTSGIRDKEAIIQDLRRPMYQKNIFYSGSVLNIPQRPRANTMTSVKSVESYVSAYERMTCFRKLPKPIADILSEMLDLKVLKNKRMLILCLGNIVGMTGFYVPIIFSADRAKQLGVPPENAAFLLSILGICNTAGRVLSGMIAFIPSVSPLLVNNICILLSGLCVILTPFCDTFSTMALSIAGYGLFGATFISLASIIICDLVGVEKLTNGFGLVCLVRGITAIAGPPLEGWLYDITGNYDATFYMGGCCLLLSGVFHCMLCLNFLKPDDTEEEVASNVAAENN